MSRMSLYLLYFFPVYFSCLVVVDIICFFYSFFQEVTQIGSHSLGIFFMCKQVVLLFLSICTRYDKVLRMTTIINLLLALKIFIFCITT